MRIYNTLTREKEELIPQEEGHFKIYACGPTVYNYIHIGNARPICVFEVLRRYLEYRGNKVTFVQNFTDIDDKIIKKANEEGTDYLTVSKKYIEEYWKEKYSSPYLQSLPHGLPQKEPGSFSGQRYGLT